MQLRVGYELLYELPQPTPMLLMLNVHYSRARDIIVPDRISITPDSPVTSYRDNFGNWCTRLVASVGQVRISTDAVLNDSGVPDQIKATQFQHPVETLPEDTLMFLLGSRYCETDLLTQAAWDLFGHGVTGTERIQAICDWVHHHLVFSYASARPTRTAWEAFNERQGVCRDFAHLAVALCRALNIPARYCTGYLSDVGQPPPYSPMDFAAWFDAYIGGEWQTFDPRNNTPRSGRILMARGRDATDVALSNTFGPNTLTGFRVWINQLGNR